MSNNDSNFITPSLEVADIYKSSSKEFTNTPAGTYRMAVAGEPRVKTTEKGERKLEVFFKHTEADARSAYKGVNLSVMLEGVDKNGNPKAKQFGDLLAALGVSIDDIVGGNSSVELTGVAEEGAEWKGIPAAIVIRGDRADLTGREAIVKVEETTFNGKTSSRATAVYKAS